MSTAGPGFVAVRLTWTASPGFTVWRLSDTASDTLDSALPHATPE